MSDLALKILQNTNQKDSYKVNTENIDKSKSVCLEFA